MHTTKIKIQKKIINQWIVSNPSSDYTASPVTIFGLSYIHFVFQNGDELFLTQYGLPFIHNLFPHNLFGNKSWFDENAIELNGSSCLYRIRTQGINGHSREIVFKWNRMGQDIPGVELADDLNSAEFNSPFEEFAIVNELRYTRYESPGKIYTQKPLAIFVPADRVELWQVGRKDYKMQMIISSHQDVELDQNRQYAMIYEWIKGVDLIQASDCGILSQSDVESITLNVDEQLNQKGFRVLDRKPHHIIVRPKMHKKLARDKSGNILFGLVDYELLERTPEREDIVRKARRYNYLIRQRDRFCESKPKSLPPHLSLMSIFDVSYIYGIAKSTDGALWVVGKDPELYDYFLPEKWEHAPRLRLSVHSQTFYTLTKDNVNLVWRVSRAGIQPEGLSPLNKTERKIMHYGYNSPFEEVGLAMEISRKGIPTTYPRAIYMTGNKVNVPDYLIDESRYESHTSINFPGKSAIQILRKDRDYIGIWGYWNGPDELLAREDGNYYKAITALRAFKSGLISRRKYWSILSITKKRLAKINIEDLNFRGNHILLSVNPKGDMVTNKRGIPEIRICNFELLRKR